MLKLEPVAVLAIVSAAFVCGGCDRSKDPAATKPSTPSSPSGTRADNTDRNRVDQDSATKTPMDQSNSGDDLKITADIRRAIMDDKSLSVNAQNCKIITDKSGVVTLRGPVASQSEKDAIEAKAKAVAGVGSVINELEVKTD